MAWPPNMQRGPAKGTIRDRTLDKINMIIRLECQNLGLTQTDIGNICGLTAQTVNRIMKTHIYRQMKGQYQSGIYSQLDDDTKNNYLRNKRKLEAGIPLAIENLLKAAMNSNDPALQFKASQDLLDRHPDFAKASRSSITVKEKEKSLANEEDEAVAAELAAGASQASVSTLTNLKPISEEVQ